MRGVQPDKVERVWVSLGTCNSLRGLRAMVAKCLVGWRLLVVRKIPIQLYATGMQLRAQCRDELNLLDTHAGGRFSFAYQAVSGASASTAGSWV